MYARCISPLAMSQQVFDESPYLRDVVSWTALIAGYVQHRHGQEALSHLDRMQLEGFAPNVVTFVGILKACGMIGGTTKGKEFHARITRESVLEKNNILGTALVDMYAKCGMVSKARRVFDELPVRDVVSWTALVAGYTQHGLGEEALQCFQQMNCEGVSPNAVTLSCILKASQSVEATQKGREVHIEIVQNGFLENDTVLGNALVDMYAKCGELKNARKVFNELPIRNVICWTSLMSGYAQHGRAEEVVNCFHQMQLEGLLPNQLTFVSILKAYCSLRAVQKGKQMHAGIVTEGLLRTDLVIGTTLMDMYAKCDECANAQEIFDELPRRNVISWNALIRGYYGQGNSENALYCFKQMQSEGICPDSSTFSCILNIYGSLRASKEGKEIHAAVVEELFLGKTNMLDNALVDMYAKCGELANAEDIFNRIPVQDVVSITTLLSGYVYHGLSEKAINFFEQVNCKGLSTDAVMLTLVLQACGNIGAAETGEKIHAEIVREDLLKNDSVLGNTVVDMYAKCGCLTKAQEVFDCLPVLDVVSWAVLIAGYARLGYAVEALHCFDRMHKKGQSANAAIYACILQACGDIGAGVRGEEIHKDIMSKGFLEKDIVIRNALLSMYTKCGNLVKVKEIFDKLPVRDVVSWTVLIMGYSQLGKHEIVFNLFSKMIGEGIQPDLVTFILVLNACTYSGLVVEGRSYLESMSASYAIHPNLEHHTCIVDLFAHAGHFDKALKMIEEIPSSEHGRIWHALLVACQRWGNVKVGKLAFDHAVKLDKKSSIAYVCMCNIYATAGMREEVHKIAAIRMENDGNNVNGCICI